jgi:dipeptidase
MDLVRLGLERARTAREALEIMTDLLEVHGQGGIADAAHQEAYDSSFLIADADGAFILDTSGSAYAAAPFPDGTAISNRLSVRTEWTVGSPALEDGEDFDRYRDTEENTAHADVRLAASRRFLHDHRSGGLTPAIMAAHLRDHGDGPWGAPGNRGPAQPPPTAMARDFSDVTVCMHAGDYSVTTSSLIAVLPAERASGRTVRAFVALGSPCSSVYVPAFPSTFGGPPGVVPRQLWSEEMWRAADAVRVHVQSDPDAIHAVRAVLDPIEDELWAEADEILEEPGRWAEVGADWGRRALDGLRASVS